MFILATTSNTAEQAQSIFSEIYTSPIATKIMFICLILAGVFAIFHKFISWFYEKDISILRILIAVLAGISLLLSVGGLFVHLNITAPGVYGFSAGAIVVLMIYNIGSTLFKQN